MTLDTGMDPDSSSSLNSGIRLSGDEFQSLVLEKILEKYCQKSKVNFSIMDAHAGEVDFWIRVSSTDILPFGLKNEYHVFIECKNYRRSLDLDSVAKILLVGVRRQPDIIAVVARTELQKQAWDYASFLFSVRRKGGIKPLFRNTQFDYYKTSDLIEVDFEDPAQPPSPPALTPPSTSPLAPLRVKAWEVIEYRPYSEIQIAGNLAPKDTVWLCPGSRYRVRLAIQVDDAMDWTIAGVLPLPNGVDAKATLDKNGIDIIDRSIIQVVIDLSAKASAAQDGLQPSLRLNGTKRRNVAVGLPFVLGMMADDNSDPGDVRSEITEDFFRKITGSEAQPVILLGGPAGVGKTYLCEQLAINLRQKAQIDVNCFTLGTDSDHRLIWDMFLTASVPPRARKTGEGNPSPTPWEAIAAAVVAKVNAVDQQEAGLDGLSGIPAQENVIPVLAGLLAAAGPRLIILRDAHRLSEVAARQLSALICGLDNRSWGKLHIILEHRTGNADDCSPWDTLQSQLRAHLNKIDEVDLQPLTQNQLDEFLEKYFEVITEDLKSRIWQLSGGLPLHLASLWSILLHEGAMEKVDDARFRILRPSIFDNIEIKGGRGASLIQARLAKIPWETVQLLSDAASFPTNHLASLLAHLHDAEQIRKFKALAEIDEIAFDKFCRLLAGEGLIHPVPPGGSDLRFRHDLLRQGLRRMVVPDSRIQDTARIIMGKVDVTTAPPCTLELYSDIANWAGFSWEAINALEAALAQLNNSVDFNQRKRLRRKLIQRLGSGVDENDPTVVQRLIAHRIALGWEEWNTGSIIEARTLFYAIAADCLKRIKRGGGEGWPEQNAANALRRAVGLELELGDPIAMAKTAQQALGLRTGWIEYNSILNRLVLYCARYSQVFLGKRFAKLALQSFSGLDPAEGARSVICSDIGSLFRASTPDTALFFYRKALEVSKREDDFRQHTYSHMELALTEALLDVEVRRTVDIDRLRSDLHQAGLQDMLSRVDMVSGALAMLEGRIEIGRMQTERALTSAHMYGRRHLLIAAENDALIGALAAGDKERGKELAVSLLKRLKLHLEMRKRSAAVIADLEPLVLQAATRLGDVLTPWELPIPAKTPLFSGTWVGALLNLKQIAATRSHLGRVSAPARTLWPDDMDEDSCRSALVASTINCCLKIDGLSLIFCAN